MSAAADALARLVFGWDAAHARAAGKSIRCRRDVDVDTLTEPDAREYALTAVCPECWDAITEEVTP